MEDERHNGNDRCISTGPRSKKTGVRDPFVPAIESQRVAPDDIKGTLHVSQEICGRAVYVLMDYDDNRLEDKIRQQNDCRIGDGTSASARPGHMYSC